MIKKVIVLCFLASIIAVFIQCKEKKRTPPLEVKATVMKQNTLVGGWKAIEVTNAVRELASYVMTENNKKSPIKKVYNAGSQVVSGKNYRFQILLANGETWEAQVYINIKKERSITYFKQV